MFSSDEEDDELDSSGDELDSSGDELDSGVNEKATELLHLLRNKLLNIDFTSTRKKGDLILEFPHDDHSIFIKSVIPRHLCNIQVNSYRHGAHSTTVTCYRECMDNLIEAVSLAAEAVFDRTTLRPRGAC
ncbi:MAG: hypothetical protein DHS20C10_01390 [marine bacterium B5-7]|nr:MAG: hypothetical protein DHS20C10_01390 [marine bacterium B5-7]